jgi:hypothetical protein
MYGYSKHVEKESPFFFSCIALCRKSMNTMTYLPVIKSIRMDDQYEPITSINIVNVSVQPHVKSVIIRKRNALYTSGAGGAVVASRL